MEPNKNYGNNGPGVMGAWPRASSYFESYAEGESEQSGGDMEVEGGNGDQDVWTEMLEELDNLGDDAEEVIRDGVERGRESMVVDMRKLAQGVFPEIAVIPGSMEKAVEEAFAAGDVSFNLENANEWARDRGWTGIPRGAVDRDMAAWKAVGYDLEVFAEEQLRGLAQDRMSVERIVGCIREDNPDYQNLVDLVPGIPVPTKPGWEPNSKTKAGWPKPSPTFRKAAAPVEAMFHDLHEKHLAVYLDKETVLEHVEGAHSSRAGWALKSEKAEGRGVVDCRELNGKWMKEASKELYGKIEHPTVGDFVRMIIDFYDTEKEKDPSVKWEDLRIYTTDLRGAYNLISWKASDVRKMGVELSDDIAMFFLCGHFGCTITPFAFQCITRALVWELNNQGLLKGVLKMYVDDIFGVCWAKDLEADLDRVQGLCRELLGPTAIAEHKTKWGRCLTVIGYTIDLDKRLVLISQRNARKALYAFMTVNENGPVTVKTMQKLASLGSRYGKVCRFLRPFVRFLYRAYKGSGDHASILLDDSAKLIVRLFRTILVLGLCNGEGELKLSRKMMSFMRRRVTKLVEFDASLSGLGLLFFNILASGEEVPVASAVVDVKHLGFGVDASFQNTSEFLAGVLAGRGVRLLGWEDEAILYRGDSISALTWMKKEGVRSEVASAAAVFYVFQAIEYDFSAGAQEHLAGVKNTRADSRSRGGTLAELGPEWEHLPELDLAPEEVLRLCSHEWELTTDVAFCSYIQQVKKVIRGMPRGEGLRVEGGVE
jgi:hypothetical protein